MIHDPDAAMLSEMSASELAENCMREMSDCRNGELSNEQYALELFRRAALQCDQVARVWLKRCFSELVLSWIYYHPKKAAAYRLDSEENYITQAFEGFWLAAAHNQQLEFSTLAGALQYLRASLNGVILDTLRAYSRSKVTALPGPDSPREPLIGDSPDTGELREYLQRMFPGEREQRLIYLLFHCGLKPREIVRYCPHEFSDVREVYLIRRNIHERLLRAADYIRWRL